MYGLTPEAHVVRPAEPSDLLSVARLAGLVWRRCYPGIISLAQIHYMLGRMYGLDVLLGEWRRGVCFDLWLRNGNLAGFSSYGPLRNGWPVKLHKLYVHPSHQRLGGGLAMVGRALQTARSRGGTSLYLTVNKRNRPALCAYRKHGFRLRRAVVADIGGGFVMDDFLMVRPLEK